MQVDQAMQTKYRDANRAAAMWLDSACATTDQVTTANCLDRADTEVDAMVLLAQTAGERTLAELVAANVSALRTVVLPVAPDKPPPPPPGTPS